MLAPGVLGLLRFKDASGSVDFDHWILITGSTVRGLSRPGEAAPELSPEVGVGRGDPEGRAAIRNPNPRAHQWAKPLTNKSNVDDHSQRIAET